MLSAMDLADLSSSTVFANCIQVIMVHVVAADKQFNQVSSGVACKKLRKLRVHADNAAR